MASFQLVKPLIRKVGSFVPLNFSLPDFTALQHEKQKAASIAVSVEPLKPVEPRSLKTSLYRFRLSKRPVQIFQTPWLKRLIRNLVTTHSPTSTEKVQRFNSWKLNSNMLLVSRSRLFPFPRNKKGKGRLRETNVLPCTSYCLNNPTHSINWSC